MQYVYVAVAVDTIEHVCSSFRVTMVDYVQGRGTQQIRSGASRSDFTLCSMMLTHVCFHSGVCLQYVVASVCISAFQLSELLLTFLDTVGRAPPATAVVAPQASVSPAVAAAPRLALTERLPAAALSALLDTHGAIVEAMAHRDGSTVRDATIKRICALLRVHPEVLPLYYKSVSEAPAQRFVVAAAVFAVATPEQWVAWKAPALEWFTTHVLAATEPPSAFVAGVAYRTVLHSATVDEMQRVCMPTISRLLKRSPETLIPVLAAVLPTLQACDVTRLLDELLPCVSSRLSLTSMCSYLSPMCYHAPIS